MLKNIFALLKLYLVPSIFIKSGESQKQ